MSKEYRILLERAPTRQIGSIRCIKNNAVMVIDYDKLKFKKKKKKGFSELIEIFLKGK